MKSATELAQQMTPAELLKRARGGDYRIDADDQQAGVIIPNSTQIPNEVLDTWMAALSGAELKVLMYIIRKTFGYNKANEGDQIPLSQIMSGTKRADGKVVDCGTGLSKSTALAAIRVLENAGLIAVVREKINKDTNEINYYKLVTRGLYNRK